MRIMAILFLLLGILALIVGPRTEKDAEQRRDQSVALNFAQFRQAVMAHVLNEPDAHDGIVDTTDLTLPEGWERLRPWQARISQNRLYVWGTASWAEVRAVRSILLNSWTLGRSEQGILRPRHDGRNITLPQFIPDGCVVSLFSLE